MDAGKKACAIAALKFIKPDSVIGVGTGSTVNYFIDALADNKTPISGAVASSAETARRLEKHNIEVFDLNMTGDLELYIDGADETNGALQLIKGGGGALTREKILASASKQFVCIVDQSKQVDILGQFPLPIEVIPMARSFVAREIVKLDADPEYREAPKTDNGNIILDCYGFSIVDPVSLEATINAIPGVVSNGLFANRPADLLLVGKTDGSVQTFSAS